MKNIILITFIAISSCNSTTKVNEASIKPKNKQHKNKIEVTITASKEREITIGEEITFLYKTKKQKAADSIKLLVDFKPYKSFTKDNTLTWNTKDFNPGTRSLHFTFYWSDSTTSSQTLKFELFSDIKPTFYSQKTVNKWPHNYKAYTQGLEFSDGFLYEGTGQYGESMLYKINLDKNEIVQSINLADELFGEGITLIDDKIYQITWRSNIGYVYDKNSLTELYDFTYPTEGWGLTNNGKELIMSDGSNTIYFLDTEFIQEIRKIQVYDNKGPIKNLNELEYIDGLIYANIYGSEDIVAFEAQSGKVTKHICLSGILNKNDVKHPIDVLNGIAWDKDKNRMIITGKWWPYFYEIELIKK